MPDYGEIDRKRAELSSRREIPIEELEDFEKWFAGQTFPNNARGQQYQHLCQAELDRLRQRIESSQREEREDRRDQESKDAEKKRLRRQDVAIVLSVVFGLIGAAGVIYTLFFSKFQHANIGATSRLTYRQTPTPTVASQEQAANSNSPAPTTKATATEQPSVTPPES